MTLINYLIERGFKENLNIGIGLSQDSKQNSIIMEAVIKFLQTNNSNILLFTNQKSKLTHPQHFNIKFMVCKNVEDEIIDSLIKGRINAIIRGSMSSSKFINVIKSRFQVNKINRLALLETASGFQFFYAPVGIDECNNVDDKKLFIKKAIKFMNFFELNPKISILSGGRESDIGRDKRVDASIEEAEQIVSFFKNQNLSIEISHEEILIENAIRKRANLIIAPDGISGNLVYRTLVHLGNGKAYGAIYLGLDKLIIDTSRVGNISEIEGALLLTHLFKLIES